MKTNQSSKGVQKLPLIKTNYWRQTIATSALLLACANSFGQCNLIDNGNFEADAPSSGWSTGNWDGGVSTSGAEPYQGGHRFCHVVDQAGTGDWSISFYQEGIPMSAGRTYSFSADIWTDQASDVKIQSSIEAPTFTWVGGQTFTNIDTGTNGVAESVVTNIVGQDALSTRFTLQLGNGLVPVGTKICFDNVEFIDPDADPDDPDGPCPQELAPTPQVLLNQHGLLPALGKIATYVAPESSALSDSAPRSWALVKSGTVVASGTTSYTGLDNPSADKVHTIDFSDVTDEGTDYVLRVTDGGNTYESHPFDIAADAFDQLKYDALSYFYHNRSGIEIESSVVGSEHSRGASHLYDQSLDTKECRDGTSTVGCRTGVDVSGGWYDAGDHGKYVVNAGISVWTLLNLYERSKYLGANLGSFADSAMALPSNEHGNGLPDLLDEVKWEIDWMLKMQIPAGEHNAGLVYHKMHDEKWTGTSFNPVNATAADNKREIWPVSTAATLDFAAVGAQCYRVYKEFDAAFAQTCLDKAIIAYNAAVTFGDTNGDGHPTEQYLRSPFTDFSADGGGQYEDLPGDRNAEDVLYVHDEFYWAATELYLAAGMSPGLDAAPYAADMQSWSSLHLSFPAGQATMDWARVSGLGLISMAVVGDTANADPNWVTTVRALIQSNADVYVNLTETQGYGVPFQATETYWGSNQNVVNNMLIIGLARDFSCDDSYLDSMQSGASYLLGRNPVGYSYITGYGENDAKYPHHRFWSNSLNGNLPKPPAGVMIGGANQGKEDAIADANLGDCAPLKCYIDNIEAFSTNEITINWNAPLVWAMAYMDEVGDGLVPSSCGGLNAQDATITLGASLSGTLDLAALNAIADTHTFEIITGPADGTAVINGGVVTYSSLNANLSNDSFTYRIVTANEVSEPATVNVLRTIPVASAACNFDVTLEPHQYSTHWQGEISIENTSAVATSQWEVIVTTEVGTTLSAVWGQNLEQLSANQYRIYNQQWNAIIQPGDSIVLEMMGNAAPNASTIGDIVLSGNTCGEPIEKTLLLDESIDGNSFYHTLPAGNFFNGTSVADRDIVANIDGVDHNLEGLFCCRGDFLLHQRGIALGEHTMTISSGSGLPQEQDTATFTFSNARPECTIEKAQEWVENNETVWIANVTIKNRGYQLGTVGRYSFEWAAPGELVLPGEYWAARLSFYETSYPGTNAQQVQREIVSIDEKTRVTERSIINGFGLPNYSYDIVPAGGKGVLDSQEAFEFQIQGKGDFAVENSNTGNMPNIGCSFGNFDDYQP